jgi:hypothetical protein
MKHQGFYGEKERHALCARGIITIPVGLKNLYNDELKNGEPKLIRIKFKKPITVTGKSITQTFSDGVPVLKYFDRTKYRELKISGEQTFLLTKSPYNREYILYWTDENNWYCIEGDDEGDADIDKILSYSKGQEMHI